MLHGPRRERVQEPICSPWMSARALLQPPELGLLVCSLPGPGLLLSAQEAAGRLARPCWRCRTKLFWQEKEAALPCITLLGLAIPSLPGQG